MTTPAAAHSRLIQLTRVRKEIADLEANPRSFIKEFRKIHKFRDVFEFQFYGDGDIYKNSVLTVIIDASLEYPFKAPVVRFTNQIYHPNVDPSSSEICATLLMQENWKPETTIEDILINVICLLDEPDLSRPINFVAAEECIKDRNAYKENCKKSLKR